MPPHLAFGVKSLQKKTFCTSNEIEYESNLSTNCITKFKVAK